MQRGTLLDYRLRIRGFLYVGRARSLSGIHRNDLSIARPEVRTLFGFTSTPSKSMKAAHSSGDKVEYAAPGGRLVQKFFVAPDLDRVFKYRHKVLEALFNPKKHKPEENWQDKTSQQSVLQRGDTRDISFAVEFA